MMPKLKVSFRKEAKVNPRPMKVEAIRIMNIKESRNPAAPESFMPITRPARRITMLCIIALVMPTDDLPRMMLSRLIGVTIISFRNPFSRSHNMRKLVELEADRRVMDIIPGVRKLK